MHRVVAAPPKSLCQEKADILVDEQANVRHQRPDCDRTRSSVFSSMSRSTSAWWS
jgi:hypothetical protein